VKKFLSLILCALFLASACGGGSLGVGSPQVGMSVTSLAFSDETVGTTSPAQSVSLLNSRTGTLNIVSIAASAGFAETHTCGSTLPPVASCTIGITFSPEASGVLTGTLSVTDNALDSPQNVALSGTGSSEVGSSGTLNGTCVRSGRRGCSVNSDPTDCPPGQQAKMPEYDSACTGHERGIRIDGASFCGGGGHCEVTP
jgi:hypothetical protein